MTDRPKPSIDGKWWVAYATEPDTLFQLATDAIALQVNANEKALSIASRLADSENNRHAFKLAAIERLMQSTNPSGKPFSFTAASDVVGSDESYKDYQAHLGNLSRELEAARNEAQMYGMRYRLILEAIRRTNKETAA